MSSVLAGLRRVFRRGSAGPQPRLEEPRSAPSSAGTPTELSAPVTSEAPTGPIPPASVDAELQASPPPASPAAAPADAADGEAAVLQEVIVAEAAPAAAESALEPTQLSDSQSDGSDTEVAIVETTEQGISAAASAAGTDVEPAPVMAIDEVAVVLPEEPEATTLVAEEALAPVEPAPEGTATVSPDPTDMGEPPEVVQGTRLSPDEASHPSLE
jgi:hypothetical protein